MDEFKAPPPTAISAPAAEVQAPATGSGSVVHQAYPLKQPEAELNEFMIKVRASILLRARRKLSALAKTKFPWPEVLLGLCTLCAGSTLGAIATGVLWSSSKAPFFYGLLPIAAVASGVAYGLLRHLAPEKASEIAQDILEELPDPDRSK